MYTVLLSTLQDLPEILGIAQSSLVHMIPEASIIESESSVETEQADSKQNNSTPKKDSQTEQADNKQDDSTPKKDTQIELSDTSKQALDSLCKTILPICNKCAQPICGLNVALCNCPEVKPFQAEYQREHKLIIRDITAPEQPLEDLEKYPFRKQRNSYSFGLGVFGGINLGIPSLLTYSFVAAISLLSALPLLLGIYIYQRGRRDDKKAIAREQGKFTAQRIKLLTQHKNSVLQRQEYVATSSSESIDSLKKKSLFLTNQPKTKLEIESEDRDVFGNPVGHFILSAAATLGTFSSIVKIAAGVTLLASSGPIGLIIAGCAAALVVGAYFAHQRHKNLSYKKDFDEKMAIVKARTTDVEKITSSSAKLNHELVCKERDALIDANKSEKEKVAKLRQENNALKFENTVLKALIKPQSSANQTTPSTVILENKDTQPARESSWTPRLYKTASPTHTRSLDDHADQKITSSLTDPMHQSHHQRRRSI